MAGDSLPLPADRGCGTMIVVVGPSGAGKDSVMSFAARHFAQEQDICFARRVITRPADAGGETHEAVDRETFARMRAGGGFAVSWDAHGLSYGIPVVARQMTEEGATVIANGSRSALAHFASAFPCLEVVMINARPDVLAERLAARGRESREAVAARLSRAVPSCGMDMTVIDNSGPLDIAGLAFIRFVQAVRQRETSLAP